VVAINNDPEAVIFERATFGLVADWSTLLPSLSDALQAAIAS
jgi:electron transfer flavoprotein alpha subunit